MSLLWSLNAISISFLLVSNSAFSQTTHSSGDNSTTPQTGMFSDMRPSEEYRQSIEYLAGKKLMRGYSDGTFRLDDRINRAEFLKVLIDAHFTSSDLTSCDPQKFTNQPAAIFKDVRPSEWFFVPICHGKQLGIARGFSDGNFWPSQPVSFAEAASMIARLRAKKGEVPEDREIWYRPSVQFLTRQNAVPPTVGRFDQLLTRGEVAEMLGRLLQNDTSRASRTYEQLTAVQKADMNFYHCDRHAFDLQYPSNWNRTYMFRDLGKVKGVAFVLGSKEASIRKSLSDGADPLSLMKDTTFLLMFPFEDPEYMERKKDPSRFKSSQVTIGGKTYDRVTTTSGKGIIEWYVIQSSRGELLVRASYSTPEPSGALKAAMEKTVPMVAVHSSEEWKTYTHPFGEISFSYPPYWSLVIDNAYQAGDTEGYRIGVKDTLSPEDPLLTIEIDALDLTPSLDKSYVLTESSDGKLKVKSERKGTASSVLNDGEVHISSDPLTAKNGHRFAVHFSYKKGEKDFEDIFRQVLATMKIKK